jgi:CheY-like chemotaxis protein
MVTQENEKIPKYDKEKEERLFILYLPNKIMEDMIQYNWMEGIYTDISKTGHEIIVVGDQRDREDLAGSLFDMTSVKWLDRPLKMEELEILITDGHLPEVGHKSKKHILIVDDDPTYLSMVREWLKQDYKVAMANSGLQALRWLGKNQADLILLDYEMPVTSGPQVLEMLRSDLETSKIPVMFLTGKSDKNAVLQVLALKPEGYFLKTIEKDELLQKLSDFFFRQIGG